MAAFLIDAQLPPALADRLREAGHEAYHVQRLGLGAASDQAIWSHACRISAVLVSKDADFQAFRQERGTAVPIVWIRWGNVTNAGLWAAFEAALPQIEAAIEAGERLIELR